MTSKNPAQPRRPRWHPPVEIGKDDPELYILEDKRKTWEYLASAADHTYDFYATVNNFCLGILLGAVILWVLAKIAKTNYRFASLEYEVHQLSNKKDNPK